MNKNLFFILAGAIALVFAVLIFVLLQGSGSDSRDFDDPDLTATEDPTLPDPGSMTLEESFDPGETLTRYKKWAQYPPYSRPLHEGQVDLLDPYNAKRPPIAVLKKKAEGCTKDEAGRVTCTSPAEQSNIKCEMTPERSISIGKGDFKVTLTCIEEGAGERGQGLRKPVADLSTKFYRKFGRQIFGSLPPIEAGDDGTNGDATAGDNIYTVLVRPTTQDWGYVFVEARFTVDGMEHVQRCNWFSTPYTVATFQDGISDRQNDGSLVVSVPVTITKPGYYTFAANLQEAGGDQRFVASASEGQRFEAGQHAVDFTFFGKIIRDKKIDGPYIVREIRGRRDNSPVTPDTLRGALESGTPIEPRKHTEPLYEYVEPLAATYTTGSYRATDFSGDEWQSPDKDRRLEYLSRIAGEE